MRDEKVQIIMAESIASMVYGLQAKDVSVELSISPWRRLQRLANGNERRLQVGRVNVEYEINPPNPSESLLAGISADISATPLYTLQSTIASKLTSAGKEYAVTVSRIGEPKVIGLASTTTITMGPPTTTVTTTSGPSTSTTITTTPWRRPRATDPPTGTFTTTTELPHFVSGSLHLTLAGLMPYRVPECLGHLRDYGIIELTIASTVRGVGREMVTIHSFNHTNKETVSQEHHLRRSDPQVQVTFTVMAFGMRAVTEVLMELQTVSMTAFGWQLSLSMKKAAMPHFYNIVIMSVTDLRMADPPTSTTSEPPDDGNGVVKKGSTATRSALPHVLALLLGVAVVLFEGAVFSENVT